MSAKSARPLVQSNPSRISLRPLLLLAILGALVILTVLTGLTAAPSLAAATYKPGSSPDPRWQSPVGPPDHPKVLSGFDPPAQRWLPGHRGVDLAAAAGQLVRAAGPGEVTHASRIADRGVVVVSHGALRTTYEPVDASVTLGDRILGGDVLGTVGIGGHCSARCLHWGLRRGEVYLDPLLLLDQQPPVLKSPTSRLARRTSNLRSAQSESAQSALGASRGEGTAPVARSAQSTPTPAAQPEQSAAGANALSQERGAGVLIAAVAIGTAVGFRSIVKRR